MATKRNATVRTARLRIMEALLRLLERGRKRVSIWRDRHDARLVGPTGAGPGGRRSCPARSRQWNNPCLHTQAALASIPTELEMDASAACVCRQGLFH